MGSRVGKEIERVFKTYNTPILPKETYEIDKDTGLPKRVTALYEKQQTTHKGKS